MKRIIVGIDGSRASEAALRWALEIAPPLGAKVRAVTVVGATRWPMNPELTAWEPVENTSIEDEGRQVLDKVIRAVTPLHQDRIERRVCVGVPVHRLLGEALGAEMIVIGSKRRGPLARLIEASIEPALIRNAGCPVVVVPEDRQIIAQVTERLDRELALVS
jgi:nucleotide-binding universal stress UspA family protein